MKAVVCRTLCAKAACHQLKFFKEGHAGWSRASFYLEKRQGSWYLFRINIISLLSELSSIWSRPGPSVGGGSCQARRSCHLSWGPQYRTWRSKAGPGGTWTSLGRQTSPSQRAPPSHPQSWTRDQTCSVTCPADLKQEMWQIKISLYSFDDRPWKLAFALFVVRFGTLKWVVCWEKTLKLMINMRKLVRALSLHWPCDPTCQVSGWARPWWGWGPQAGPWSTACYLTLCDVRSRQFKLSCQSPH